MAKDASDGGGEPGIPTEFWEELDKHIDARNDAAFERWLAKVEEEGKVDAAPPGDGRGAAAAGGGVPTRRSTDKPAANPRDPKASGGNFFDTLSRVALGGTGKPKS